MTAVEATALIRDCAASDYRGDTGGDTGNGGRALQMWVEVELGMGDDSAVANALAVLGTEEAVDLYDDTIGEHEQDALEGRERAGVES